VAGRGHDHVQRALGTALGPPRSPGPGYIPDYIVLTMRPGPPGRSVGILAGAQPEVAGE
jgi:hypothetical protein